MQQVRVQTATKITATGPGQYEAEMPPPLALSDLPPALAATLQHIVNKLDMVAQVVGMVEERLSLNEDKLMALEGQLRALRPPPAEPQPYPGEPSQPDAAAERLADL